jgi:hypothetical protein
MKRSAVAITLCMLALGVPAPSVWAHAVAGNRIFPATLAFDDPAVSDELALPSFSRLKSNDGTETDIGASLSKTISPNLGVSVSGDFLIEEPSDSSGSTTTGFDNPAIGVKYLILRNDPHEILLSVGLDWAIGGVGSKDVGASSFSTLSPALFFGKGFGDLPESVNWLRPFALTGTFGADVPLKSGEGDNLTYGFTIQYSLLYLQSHVKDIGLPTPFDKLIPLVEFAFDSPVNGGRTTGTINPGLTWVGKYFEVGVEAIIPMNADSGRTVGVRALIDFFLDDIFPRVFHPIFGKP